MSMYVNNPRAMNMSDMANSGYIFPIIYIILQNNNCGNLVNNRFSLFASCIRIV